MNCLIVVLQFSSLEVFGELLDALQRAQVELHRLHTCIGLATTNKQTNK